MTTKPETDRPPTIYVSGPMTNMPDHNFPAFNHAAKRLRDAGFVVHNPAENVMPMEHPSWSDYLRFDLQLVCQSDGVCALVGWQRSKGATLELHVARELGIPIRGLSYWMGDDANAWSDPAWKAAR